MQTTIDLLRHGEVLGGSCYRGRTNDPLTEKGWGQMEHKIDKQDHWDIIVSSPLSRCHDFAQSLSKKIARPLSVNPAFQEFNFGDWEGKTAEQIDPHLLNQFYKDPVNFPPPNGEPFHDFQHRILTAWLSLLKTDQNKNILLITHAGVIRIILAHILSLDTQHSFRLKISHACLSSVDCFQIADTEDFFQLTKHG